MAELLDRARLLVAAGPHAATASEIAAVHAALYPGRDAVCQDCRGELGKAYYAIKRWVTQQDTSSSTSISSNVKKGTTARFHSDELTYTPHGLGVAYTNANLTDKAARDILKADPDAAQFFAVLPPEAEEGEDEQPQSSAQAAATQAVEKAEQSAQAPAADFDYTKLASAMLDEIERRNAEATGKASQARIDAAQQPALTASAGGAAEGDATPEINTETLANGVEVTIGQPDSPDGEPDSDKPVRLSRMNKEQLLAAYRAEVQAEGGLLLVDAHNDDLRNAIAEKRASLQDPE